MNKNKGRTSLFRLGNLGQLIHQIWALIAIAIGRLSIVNSASAASNYVENFNDAAAQGWLTVDGAWAAASGYYANSANVFRNVAFYGGDTWSNDYTYSVRLYSDWSANGNRAGAVFGYEDENNYYSVTFDVRGASDTGSTIYLERVVNGAVVWTQTSTTPTVYIDTWFNVDIARVGTTATIRIDGVDAIANVTLPSAAAGHIGVISRFNMTRADDVTVVLHANYSEDFDDGLAQGWSTVNGAWNVTSGRYENTANVYSTLAYYGNNTWETDYVYDVRLYSDWASSGNRVGAVFNYQSINDFYAVWFDVRGLSETTSTIYLERHVNGVATWSQVNTSLIVDIDTWFDVQISRAGSLVTVMVNGDTAFSNVAMPTATAGHIGVVSRFNMGRFDDVGVYSSAGDVQAPTIPSALTASAASTAQVNLSWGASTDNIAVTGYSIERCQGAACTAFTQVGTPVTTSYADTGRTAATTYRYRVRARDAAGNYSGYSNVVSITTPSANDTQAPTAPSALNATSTGTSQISLGWTASTDNVAVTAYLIERCTGASCTNYTQVATSTSVSYSDTGLAASTSFRYRVRARDAANNISGYSNVLTVATSTPVDSQSPTTPGGLAATAASSTQINLVWSAATDNVGVTAYLIERCQGSSCTSFSQTGTASTTSYNDSGRTASTTYRYRIRARDAANNVSAYSAVVTATTPAVTDTQAPTAPSGLTLTPSATTTVRIALSWIAASDNVAVTRYLIERCQGAGCSSYAQVATTTTNSYVDNNVVGLQSYGYRVRARDAANNVGPYSNQPTTVPPTCD